MIKILLSAGHGAGREHNRGGVCFNEGDNNYAFSLELKKELETYADVKVDLIREKITDNPEIHDRAAMGKGYDLYYSIHSNGVTTPTVQGTEVFDSVEKPNLALAKLICDSTAAYFNHNNRGVKYREGQPGYNYYGELRFNQAKSSMIVENGFHTNASDCNTFKNGHKELAVIQARGIASHYKLTKKAIIIPKHWAEDVFNKLKMEGLSFSEKRFDDKITRGEVFAVAWRIVEWVIKRG